MPLFHSQQVIFCLKKLEGRKNNNKNIKRKELEINAFFYSMVYLLINQDRSISDKLKKQMNLDG
jgi:hypothetical protein